MKQRETVLAKVQGCLVLIEVKPGSPGKCPQCGETQFRLSRFSGKSWIECCNDDCDFEVLASHVREIEAIPTQVSRGGDCRP